MAREINTTELTKRLGGELKGTNAGYVTTDTQPNFVSPSQGSERDDLKEFDPAGYPGTKFDVAVAFFESKGVPRTLARTYGAVLLDTAKRTGRDISELIKITSANKLTFDNDALTQMNVFRPKTSQIGYRLSTAASTNEFIIRSILP